MPHKQSQSCMAVADPSRLSSLASPINGVSKSNSASAQAELLQVDHDSPRSEYRQNHHLSSNSSRAPSYPYHGEKKVPRNGIPSNPVGPQFHSVLHPPPPPPPGYIPPPPSWITHSVSAGGKLIPNLPPITSDLDEEQEELRDTRDDVLGSRFAMQSKRKELRDLRQLSGAKEGELFTMMQRFIHEMSIDMPQDIQKAVNDASILRDRLGSLEAEYDEAEATYNAAEWKYTQKETEFVEKLLEQETANKSPNPAEPTIQAQSLPPFTMHNPSQTLGSTLTDRIGPTYSPEAPGSVRDMTRNNISPDRSVLQGMPSLLNGQVPIRSENVLSEHKLFHKRPSWDEKLKFIDDWFFTIFSGSRMQKAFFRAGIEGANETWSLDVEDWWSPIESSWDRLNQDEKPNYHTGDSTVSRLSDINHDSTSLVDLIDLGDSQVDVALGTPLLRPDHALDNCEQIESPPSKLEPEDLTSQSIQNTPQFPLAVSPSEIDLSVDTGNSSRRTSRSSGRITDITTGTSEHPGPDIRRGLPCEPEPAEPLDNVASTHELATIEHEPETPDTPTQLGQDENSSTTPRQVWNTPEMPSPVSNAQEMSTAMAQALNRIETPHEHIVQSDGIEFKTVSLAKCDSPIQVSPIPTRPSIAGHANTTASRTLQFPIPFLRLTPLPLHSCSPVEHQFVSPNFSFVAHSDEHLSEISSPGSSDPKS